MAKAVRVDVQGLINSFKPGRDVRYHRTLELPHRTTLLGFFGAALGLGDRQLYDRYNGDEPLADLLDVACLSNGLGGRLQDYWTIIKYAGSKIPFRAMQVREQLYKPQYTIYAKPAKEVLVDRIWAGVSNPAYPLCLGRDDELVRVVQVSQVELVECTPPFGLGISWIPLEATDALDENAKEKLRSSFRIFYLARSFKVENDIRRELDVRPYVLPPSPLRVDKPLRKKLKAYREAESQFGFICV